MGLMWEGIRVIRVCESYLVVVHVKDGIVDSQEGITLQAIPATPKYDRKYENRLKTKGASEERVVRKVRRRSGDFLRSMGGAVRAHGMMGQRPRRQATTKKTV